MFIAKNFTKTSRRNPPFFRGLSRRRELLVVLLQVVDHVGQRRFDELHLGGRLERVLNFLLRLHVVAKHARSDIGSGRRGLAEFAFLGRRYP